MFTFASANPARPPPGTDLMMACNAVTRTADTGALRGTLYAALPPKNLKKQANVSDMLIVAAVGALLGQGEDVGDVIKATCCAPRTARSARPSRRCRPAPG
jgi:hypothetical protein